MGPVDTETHGILDSSLWGNRTLEYVEALGCLTCHLCVCMDLVYFILCIPMSNLITVNVNVYFFLGIKLHNKYKRLLS